jgi:hypothetical protein
MRCHFSFGKKWHNLICPANITIVAGIGANVINYYQQVNLAGQGGYSKSPMQDLQG